MTSKKLCSRKTPTDLDKIFIISLSIRNQRPFGVSRLIYRTFFIERLHVPGFSLKILPSNCRRLGVYRLHLVKVLLRHVGPHRDPQVIPHVLNPFFHKLNELVQVLEPCECVLQELLPLPWITDLERLRKRSNLWS